ncbi:MAG: HAD-IC family P-type ATPase [Saprospiraceae bacterium]|nr:HAD-IC family P-type ATPase [Saprospiraceae bacterium]
MDAILEKTDITQATKTYCKHCGDECPDTSIQLEEKYFCCEGCKMVYEILNEQDLCAYYQIDEKAGISLRGRTQAHYAYLDDPEVVQKLVEFADEKQVKASFHLPDIHCASCIWLLENLYKLNDGIIHSQVNFLKKQVRLTFDPKKTTLRKVVELLASIGYTPALNLNELEKTTTKAVSKSLFYKLGVAGFAFGNIMLLSFPEYLGLEETYFQQWFGYLNIALSIPVLLYCSRDYLQSAWLGIQQRQLNIDVPISIGIFALFLRSVYEIITATGAGYLDSLAGLIFFLLIGKWFQQKTYYNLSFERDYKSYFPISAMVKRANAAIPIALNKLQIGDILLIKNQELIPADGLILKGNANIDYSFVTGESAPVQKQLGEKIFAGGKQMGGELEISITKTITQSYLTELWNNTAFEKEEPQSTQLATQISKFFTVVILTVAFFTLAYWLPRNLSVAFNAFTAVLIIACPCAVAISIPFTYGNVLRVLARYQFYLKHVNVIDRMQGLQQIVFDKTGTLTDNTQPVILFHGSSLTDEDKQLIRSVVYQSSHPLSRALDKHFVQCKLLNISKLEEIIGKGIIAEIDGIPVRVGAASLMLDVKNEITPNPKGVFVEINNELKGYFSFQNRYRKNLSELLNALSNRYELALLSGDNDSERQRLQPYFGDAAQLHFNKTPQDKLNFIQQAQQHKKVMMIGDGLNDAGALKQSDVGIVITENINNFSPACDAILTAEHLDQLPKYLNYIQQSRMVVFGAYFLALIYNIIGLSFAVARTTFPPLLRLF